MERHRPFCADQLKMGTLLLLGAILLLGACLRLWDLAGPALWWDEGNNAYFAQQNLPDLVRMSRLTNDTDPPAHRLALKFWLGVLGDSAYNLRLLSVVCGVLTIPLVFIWGRWLRGDAAGLLAALLWAVSPLAIYYSREAKAYPFVTLFGTLGLYVWSRHLQGARRQRPWLWGVYVISGVLTLGSHYYAVLLYAAQGAWLLVEALRMGFPAIMRDLRNWLLAQGAILGLLSPWLLLTYDTALGGAHTLVAESGPLDLGAYLLEIPFYLAGGPHGRDWAAGLALAALLVGAAWGVRRFGDHQDGGHRWLLLLTVLLPVVAGFFVQLYIPFFQGRFLLYITPALYLLVAVGVVDLKWWASLFALPLILAWVVLLPAAYTPFASPEEDLRPVARTLRDLAEPEDAIVAGYIWQEGILRMYAPGISSSYYLGWFDQEDVGEALHALFDRHRQLWLVTYRVPLRHSMNAGGEWLEQNAARAMYEEYGYNRLALYVRSDHEAGMSAFERVTFEEGLALSYRPRSQRVTAGRVLPLTLRWTVGSRPPSDPYKIFAHLIDEDDRIWSQRDGRPQNGMRPFEEAAPGETLVDHRALLIPEEAPPGQYRVRVGLYHAHRGDKLQIVGEVEETPWCVVAHVEVVED
ncbi:MAG: glycosyltransferase family 39 protein [Anaerolineae bacterium]